jgi:hypothetical protein
MLMTIGIGFCFARAISHYVMSVNEETIGHRREGFQMALAYFYAADQAGCDA